MNVSNDSPTAPPQDRKTSVVAKLIQAHATSPIRKILVVGCGSGLEAAVLAVHFSAETIGVDLDDSQFVENAQPFAQLEAGDATKLRFGDNEFDLVYSYHVIEHIPDFRTALKEIARVTQPNGIACIGTPNRARLIGYFSSKDTPLRDKILWNWNDWKYRLRGKFRNEYGAHAGFTSRELQKHLSEHFPNVTEITLDYYQNLYRSKKALVTLLARSGLGRFLFPAIYFLCGKRV